MVFNFVILRVKLLFIEALDAHFPQAREFPNVPTLKELGYPDLVVASSFGFSATAGCSSFRRPPPRTLTPRLSTAPIVAD